MANIDDHSESARTKSRHAIELQLVEDALARLRFGVINLTVHDGKVVQIDITERRRFSS